MSFATGVVVMVTNRTTANPSWRPFIGNGWSLTSCMRHSRVPGIYGSLLFTWDYISGLTATPTSTRSTTAPVPLPGQRESSPSQPTVAIIQHGVVAVRPWRGGVPGLYIPPTVHLPEEEARCALGYCQRGDIVRAAPSARTASLSPPLGSRPRGETRARTFRQNHGEHLP